MDEIAEVVQVRMVCSNRVTADRAVRQLGGVVGLELEGPHPGRKGDWLVYGRLRVRLMEGEVTRRRRVGLG